MPAAPQGYRTAGTLMRAAGFFSVMIGIALVVGLLWLAGPCCCLGVAPLGFGMLELFVGQRVATGERTKLARPVSYAGVAMGVLTFPVGGFVPLALELMAAVSLRDPAVVAYLAGAQTGSVDPQP